MLSDFVWNNVYKNHDRGGGGGGGNNSMTMFTSRKKSLKFFL
jgi:hypothetical protein